MELINAPTHIQHGWSLYRLVFVLHLLEDKMENVGAQIVQEGLNVNKRLLSLAGGITVSQIPPMCYWGNVSF